MPSYKAAAAFTCADYPDAGRLADLFAKMKAEITACGEDALYNDIEFPLAQVLADMTRTGVLVDKDGIEQFGVKLREELEQVLTRIHMETGSATFNPNSPKQLGEMLFDTMGLPHGKKTQRGWSTDAETLESLREYPLVEDVLQYRAYQKLNSTYVEGLLKVIGEDGRIHSTFNQTEARTGRLSSDNPNLQNIPIRTELGSQLRAYFVAKPGCVLVDADYSQIELRILAHITGDEHMQQAFLNGEDIHRSTAAKIYGIPQSEVTPRLRSSAKAINFGIMYGKGAYSLSKDIGVTVKEADAFLKNYLAAFPSVSGYMDKTIADAKANGYVSTLFGRRHCEFISATVKKALLDAGKTIDDVDAVAVTFAPGLIGAVLVGVNFAKGLAYSAGKPLVPVHHLRGHIAALYLTHPELKPPFLCLVASGGHSHIVEVQDYTHYHILGHTVDDAAGEAFDKVARTLGLPYPGGPSVAAAAKTGDPKAYRLPVPHVEGKYNVSFSGLKTAVLNEVNKAQMKGEEVNVPDLAASFQERIAGILAEKLLLAAADTGAKQVCLAGGVAANGRLRQLVNDGAQKLGAKVYLPELKFCGDNGAMIAAQGYYQYIAGHTAGLELNGLPTLPIDYE